MKILYYAIIVLFQVKQALSNSESELCTRTDQDKFILAVNKFHYDLQEDVDMVNYADGIENNSIQPQVFDRFESNLFLILQHIANYYSYNEHGSLKYILTVCPLLPRLLDFLYMRTVQFSNIILLNRMYIVLCKKVPSFYKNYNNEYTSDTNQIHIKGQLDELKRILKQLPVKYEIKKQQFLISKDKRNEVMNTDYISEVYTLIGNINMIPIMINNPGIQLNDMFINYSQYQNMKLKTPKSLNNIMTESQRVDERSFYNVNEVYSTKINQNQCGKLNIDIKGQYLSNPTVINELMLFTFEWQIKFYIHYTSVSLITSNDHTEYLNFKNNILNMLDDTCNYFPLILMYLIESNINDTNLLSLYLTLCSISKGFANFRCSSVFPATIADEGSDNNRNCILELTRNYLTKNMFTIINKVPESDSNLYNEICMKASSDFIRDYHSVLKQFLNGRTVPVWTTFEWLSGTYFMIEDYEDEDMNSIKTLDYNSNQDDNMSLSVAYYTIFPWILNGETIMIFHDTIISNLISTMNNYVFVHAQIIYLYFNENQNFKGNKKVKQDLISIRNSLNWYDQTKSVNEYLYLPYVEGLNKSNKIDSIIEAISNLNETNYTNMDKIIPGHIKTFVETLKEKYDKYKHMYGQWHNVALNWNCNAAILFVKSFVSIVNISMRTKVEFNNFEIMSKYCFIDVFKVEYNAKTGETSSAPNEGGQNIQKIIEDFLSLAKINR